MLSHLCVHDLVSICCMLWQMCNDNVISSNVTGNENISFYGTSVFPECSRKFYSLYHVLRINIIPQLGKNQGTWQTSFYKRSCSCTSGKIFNNISTSIRKKTIPVRATQPINKNKQERLRSNKLRPNDMF